MAQSQTALYGELLTNEQLYRRDIGQIAELTKEQEQELLARARLGDADARQHMVCVFLPCVLPLVARYARLAKHTDFLDLCQEVSLEMIETLDKALEAARPFAYWYGVARLVLVRYLRMYDPLVRKKCHSDCGGEDIEMLSLDIPLKIEPESEQVWDEVLVAPSSTGQVEGESSQYDWLYQAVGRLTEYQRGVIERYFGLNGCPEESLSVINEALTGQYDPKSRVASLRKHKALLALRQRLGAA